MHQQRLECLKKVLAKTLTYKQNSCLILTTKINNWVKILKNLQTLEANKKNNKEDSQVTIQNNFCV